MKLRWVLEGRVVDNCHEFSFDPAAPGPVTIYGEWTTLLTGRRRKDVAHRFRADLARKLKAEFRIVLRQA